MTINSKEKQGQIWISAILFLSIGVMIIVLMLSAIMPVVDRLADRNTLSSTKNLLLEIDETIKTVAREGPGSQRNLDITLNKGELYFQNDTYQIKWIMETESELMEKGIDIPEGNIVQHLNATRVDQISNLMLWITSDKYNTSINSRFSNPFTGKHTLTVKHTGIILLNDNPLIELKIT